MSISLIHYHCTVTQHQKKPHTKYTSSYMAFLILFLFTETPVKPENFTPYSALCLLLYCG
nr:MAG TPA: hypothetical protein [Caudoviricetes sp.]